MKHWASVYLGGKRLLVPPSEWQVIAFLPSVGNLAFLLFGGLKALLMSGTLGSAGSPMVCGKGSLLAPAE
jgi:hypothetical protein